MKFNVTINSPSPLLALGSLVFNGTAIWLGSVWETQSVPYTVYLDGKSFSDVRTPANDLLYYSAVLDPSEVHSLVLQPASLLKSVVVEMDLGDYADTMLSMDDGQLFEQDGFVTAGTWRTDKCLGDGRASGTCHVSEGSGSEIAYTFEGDAITLWGAAEDSSALYHVSMDGADPISYAPSKNTSTSSHPVAVLAHYSNLGPGSHTIKLQSLPRDGKSRIEVDYAQVYTKSGSTAGSTTSTSPNTSTSPTSGVVPLTPSIGSLSKRATIGIIVGSILGAVLLTGLFFLYKHRQQKKRLAEAAAARRAVQAQFSVNKRKSRDFDEETLASSRFSVKEGLELSVLESQTEDVQAPERVARGGFGLRSPPYASPSTGAEDIEGQQPPGTSGGASARFDVFAFSVPPPTGDRSSRRDDDAPRDLNSARWATPMSLATPYSEPPITPQDDQALPLPLPVHVRTPWTRYTTDSRTLDPVPQTVSTIPRSADSIPPERVSHNPPEEQRPGNGSAPAPNTASSSDNSDDLPIKEIELQAYDPSDPREFRPSSSLRERPQTDEPGEDDSPYPEVRACVSNTDDLDMPAMTLRMWFIGLTLSVLAACANLFLSLRYPSVYLGPTVIILVAFAVGKLLERITPIRLWIIPSWIPLVGDHSICLNPGPFNIKEHGLISMMANLCANPSYGLTVVLTARNRYNLTLGPGFSFCLYTSILILPFSFGWFTRRLFVYPSSKIWPTNLVLSAMLNTLHAGSVDEDYRLSRLRFFVFVAVSYTCYSFLPDYLFTGLSYFSFICWIRPSTFSETALMISGEEYSWGLKDNVVVNQLFGAVTGLGMSALTFDWSQIALIGSPLMVPWTVSMQIFAGFVVFYWIVLPILYYTNAWKTGHLPIMGYMAYDRFAQEYDMNRVLNPDKTLNVTAYQEYSPVYIPIGFVVTYLVAFVFTTAVIVATAFDHGREIVRASKSKNIGDDDIHARLMKNYPEVPGLWYVGAVLVSLGLAIATIKIADVDTPVWGLFMAIAVAGAYTIPELYIYSCAGKLGTMNLTVELIGGNIWRGKPLPVMVSGLDLFNQIDSEL
ncbi:hypothetical protein FRB90_008678 [Tulasnella sp. 427]|nr:hypothetical protein FRB90_008678 [Tulasnella sp. 427]